MKPANETMLQNLKAALGSSPLFEFLNITVVNIGPGECDLELEFRKELTHLGPFVHSGILATLADAALSAALIPLCPLGSRISSIDLTTRFYRSISNGKIAVKAKIKQRGKKICHLYAELQSEDGSPLAEAHASYLVEPPQAV